MAKRLLTKIFGNRFKSANNKGTQGNVLKGAGCATGYIPALDGLRGIAVLLVVLHHYPMAAPAGYIGVDVFFVLSGYLICGLLLHEWEKTGRISLLRFYMRRFLRLMPALWALVLVVLVAQWLHDADGVRRVARAAMWTVLYLVNWVRALRIEYVPWFHHTWSLAVEEQFYLLWPALLCFAVRRGGARRVFQVALALALLSWAWRAGLLWAGERQGRLYHGLDTRFDAPMWGCALLRPLLCWPPLVQLGVVSYGVYLWHIIVTDLLGWTQPSALAAQMAKIIGGTAAAMLSFYIVERPFLRLKKRFEVR